MERKHRSIWQRVKATELSYDDLGVHSKTTDGLWVKTWRVFHLADPDQPRAGGQVTIMCCVATVHSHRTLSTKTSRL